MAKIELNTDVTNYQTGLPAINDNFRKLEEVLQDEVLFRDNPEGEPNQLESDIDVNGKILFNLPDPTTPSQAATKKYVDGFDFDLSVVKVVSDNIDSVIEVADISEDVSAVASISEDVQIVAGMGTAFDASELSRENAFLASQADKEARFQAFLLDSGYEFLGDYAAGIEFTEYNQIVRAADGEFWRVSGSQALPYTTTGAGVPEGGALVSVGDAALRQELAAPSGTELIGFDDITVADALQYPVADYTEFRAYTGDAKYIIVTGQGISGYFIPLVSGSDNGGTIIVDGAGRRWGRLFSGAVNVRWFGAVGDGVTDDAAAIQAAIQASASSYIPEGVYIITVPIYLDRDKTIYGDGPSGTVPRGTTIKKTTSTVGSGSNEKGLITDTYEVDAAIIIRHDDNSFSYNVRISDMQIVSDSYISEYGIYAPRIAQSVINNVEVRQFRYGINTFEAFLCAFSSVVVNSNSASGGWGDAIAWMWTPTGGGASGTSCSFTNCWARDCQRGWHIIGLQYSSMHSCAADNINGQCYFFQSCDMSITSCGMENSIASIGGGLFQISAGRVSVSGLRSLAITGGTSGSPSMFAVTDNGVATINESVLNDFDSVNSAFNINISAGGRLVSVNTSFPTNANPFISYSSGGSWLETTNGNLVRRDSSGVKYYRTFSNQSGTIYNGTTNANFITSSTETGAYLGETSIAATETGGNAMYLNRLASDGSIAAFRRGGALVGSVAVTTTGTSYNVTSDYRLKNEVVDLFGSGIFIDKLRPRFWKWAENGKTGSGFIAHEIQDVSPSSVLGDKDATENGNPVYQQVFYSSPEIIANIVAEIKSLRVRVAILENAEKLSKITTEHT